MALEKLPCSNDDIPAVPLVPTRCKEEEEKHYSIPKLSFVAVAADVKRLRENDFACDKCSIFGIDQAEHQALAKLR